MPMGLSEMVEKAIAKVEAISAQEVRAGLDSGEVDLVIDVREPNEWSAGHIPGAINVPRGMLELRADPESPVADHALSANKDARRGRLLPEGTGRQVTARGSNSRGHGVLERRRDAGRLRGVARRTTAGWVVPRGCWAAERHIPGAQTVL